MSFKDNDPEGAIRKSTGKELTTLFTGRHCIDLNEVDSTNSRLSTLLNNKLLPEGTALRTHFQTGGRGQQGSVWISEKGKNLLQSFVFYPSFLHPKDVFLVNKAFALGVSDFASEFLGSGVRIKWPNDIYYDTMKIGGLLIENAIKGSRLSFSILGIGINVNQLIFPHGLPNPGSFSGITGKKFDNDLLFSSLCSFLENRYLSLKKGDIFKIEKDYISVLFGLNELMRFTSGGDEFKGIIIGVTDNGKLMVQKENGTSNAYDFKQIAFVWNK